VILILVARLYVPINMFAGIKSTKHIIQFLLDTEVGNRTAEKEKERKDEERDEVNGWDELMEKHIRRAIPRRGGGRRRGGG
jgi:hypothetical protein